MRSEDDLRAAFAAKAGEAPAAERVLHGVRQAESRRPAAPRRWLAPAVAVAAAAAVGVPLALAVSHSSNSSSKKAGGQANAPASPPGARAPSAASTAGGGNAQTTQEATGIGVCRPSDVTVTLRRDGTAGRLIVTSHGTPCRLARVPGIRWPSDSTTYSSTDTSGGKPALAGFGVLPASGTASAGVSWTGCGLPDGTVVTVDWGSGPVQVPVSSPSSTATCTKAPRPASPGLTVGPLTGLS